MKKYILTILILLLTANINAEAQLTPKETMSAIENNVFGYEYNTNTDIKRIERIEEHLYGQKKTGTLQKRLENIQNDAGLNLDNKKAEFNNDKNLNSMQNTNLPDLKEDATVEYPMVDKIEQELFNTCYKKENIYTRLNRLEEKVFGKTSNEDLNTRVDKLASVIKPKKQMMSPSQNYNYTPNEMNDYYNNSGLETVNDQSVPFQLAALEEDLLRSAYMNDNISNRLNRLEQKLFNRTFSSDTDITRLQRIMVAYDAKKNSYKYENNRKMQNMATATQIGGILLMILAMLL